MYDLAKRILFSLDAETAHRFGMSLISLGLAKSSAAPDEKHATHIFDKPIPHPIGLAAGFDKSAEAIDEWENLGFAFVEIGTVTPLPQTGNPRPRLFRLPECAAIINRMGFNNDGADVVARRLERRETRIPVGVNIGKNKETPAEMAASDYSTCARKLAPLADYLVVNVSSPNTPGLRDLQAAHSLKTILDSVMAVAGPTPVAVKISPDSHDEDIMRMCDAAIESGLAGIVATNTTVSRVGVTGRFSDEQGGVSGEPLRDRAREVCAIVKARAGGKLFIIGVGGITTGRDALVRRCAGADALQIYSSFVFRGPSAVSQILSEMR